MSRRAWPLVAAALVVFTTIGLVDRVEAAELVGTTNADALAGSCNVVYRGFQSFAGANDTSQIADLVCNAVVPSGVTVGRALQTAVPAIENNQAVTKTVGMSTVDDAGPCAPMSTGGVRFYWLEPASPSWLAGCGSEGHTNSVVMQLGFYATYGTAFTQGASQFQAVQFRQQIAFLPAEHNGNTIKIVNWFRNWDSDAAEAARLTAMNDGGEGTAPFIFLRSDGVGLGLGFAGSATAESMQQATTPPVPADYFTGGSGTSNEPCTLVSWAGPGYDPDLKDLEFVAGREYSFTFSYRGRVDEISFAWNDIEAYGNSPGASTDLAPFVTVPATGSPFTLNVTPPKTGLWVPSAMCKADTTWYTWGDYFDLEQGGLGPGGLRDDDIGYCLESSGIGLAPSSWVPAAGRTAACILGELFIPDETPLQDLKDAYSEAFPFNVIVDLMGMVTDTLGAATDGLSSSPCPHVDFRVLMPSQLSQHTGLDVHAPTPSGSGCAEAGGVAGNVGGYRTWLRNGARFGLWFVVLLGLSRKVGPKEGPLLVKP